MTPRSSKPIVAALRRLSNEGITARLYCEGFGRTCLRVEALAAGPATPERLDEVRRAVRRAVADPDLRVVVNFDHHRRREGRLL